MLILYKLSWLFVNLLTLLNILMSGGGLYPPRGNGEGRKSGIPTALNWVT